MSYPVHVVNKRTGLQTTRAHTVGAELLYVYRPSLAADCCFELASGGGDVMLLLPGLSSAVRRACRSLSAVSGSDSPNVKGTVIWAASKEHDGRSLKLPAP